MRKVKTKRYCQLPKVRTITCRSSSITNAFFNAIIPVHTPTPQDERDALAVLEMNPEDIRCVYCGNSYTEWDHLRPIIRGKGPSRYITEIANLVPACGKCNQSKGAYEWDKWMLGPALLSPKTRGVADIDHKVMLLRKYESWRKPIRVDLDSVIVQPLLKEHQENLQKVLALLKESQVLANKIRELLNDATPRTE
ncbi:MULTISPECIES: HNH endonuclease [Acidobacteriaceae]|uniref:HNH endonuclease n=1 Tax=Acidobacteriaceae TaxID=204434 RepID=UPI00131AC3EB|nr:MULTISPECIES: HNH endonuclease [Acidobacteriaceae]MDW5264188.1 HNH endonuclease [Edaphobacter sp.]